MVTPLKTYFQPRNKPSPRHTTAKRWHSRGYLRNALHRPHTENIIQLFVPTLTSDTELSAVRAYLFPRGSPQADIRGPGLRLQTVVDLTHLVTRCQSISDAVIRDLPYVTQIINCRQGITHAQALTTLRAGGIDPTDIELLGVTRNNNGATPKRGDTVVVVWKRVWYPGESVLVICPPISHQLLAGFRAKNSQKPRQYSHYLPIDDITARQRDCDTVSNYPRQAELGHEGNMCHSTIYEYKEATRGRCSPISVKSSRPTAFAGYWLAKLHETRRTDWSGRPQRQSLHLPDDPYPDGFMRVECRRQKAASEDMLHKADLTAVRTSLEAATAAQSYHQAQIIQLSQDLNQLREQLKSLTEKQSSDTAAQSRGSVLNPTADTYCPQSPTSSPRTTAPTPKEKRQTPALTAVTGVAYVSPAPGTPAAQTTSPSPPALPRRNTTGGFAAAFKTAVLKSVTRSTPTAARPPAGSPIRAGTTSPPSAPTTELTPPASGRPAGEALKLMLDRAQVGEYPEYSDYSDCSEGDY